MHITDIDCTQCHHVFKIKYLLKPKQVKCPKCRCTINLMNGTQRSSNYTPAHPRTPKGTPEPKLAPLYRCDCSIRRVGNRAAAFYRGSIAEFAHTDKTISLELKWATDSPPLSDGFRVAPQETMISSRLRRMIVFRERDGASHVVGLDFTAHGRHDYLEVAFANRQELRKFVRQCRRLSLAPWLSHPLHWVVGISLLSIGIVAVLFRQFRLYCLGVAGAGVASVAFGFLLDFILGSWGREGCQTYRWTNAARQLTNREHMEFVHGRNFDHWSSGIVQSAIILVFIVLTIALTWWFLR